MTSPPAFAPPATALGHGETPPAASEAASLTGLRARIRADGPVTVAAFMAEALLHPRHGYYTQGDGIGADGDFVTAPEISQMFGELLGLWCIDTWHRLGAPAPFALVELGPGRGTLMADLLRTARLDAAFADALRPVLVEASPALRARQAARIAHPGATWVADLEALPPLPALVLANEFVDALPVHQLVRLGDGWHERLVGLDPAGALRFEAAADPFPERPPPAPSLPAAAAGTVLELRPAADALVARLAEAILGRGGAALIVDYGSTGAPLRDTLQAVRRHRRAEVLSAPGSADLTAHVDFTALAGAARAAGCAIAGPETQGGFLQRLGLGLRAQRLAAARPDQAEAIAAAARRLADPAEMGALFKALAILPPGTAACAGFDGVAG